MALQSVEAVAFSRPGGEIGLPSRRRPVDLVHLAKQTFGDRALEAEVLTLFTQQAASVRDRIVGARAEERKRLAHGLRGSAAGVGAFPIAECAAELEAQPGDVKQARHLVDLIDEARCFVASISR